MIGLEAASLDPPSGLGELLAELGAGENAFGGTPVHAGEATLEEYLQQCCDMPDRSKLEPGLVPQTVFWVLNADGEAIGMVLGANILRELFDERYYEDLSGGLLEGMGRLFKRQVNVFVHPWLEPDTDRLHTAETLDLAGPEATLFRYLLDQNRIVGIEDYDPELLSIRSDMVRQAIREGGDWERFLAPRVVELIRERGFFGCRRD